MWGMTNPLFGFLAGLGSQPTTQLEELQLRVSEQEQNLHRLQAQRVELDAEVRKLREELQQVRGQRSHVGEESELSEDEESGEFWDAKSEISESGDSQSELSDELSDDEEFDEFWDAKSEISDDPESEGSFSFTKAVGTLAVGATVAAAVLCPATLPVVAFTGVRAVLVTKSIEDDPVTGTIGTAATLATESMIPCASSAKFLVQTGKSIHQVELIARYGSSVASYGLRTVRDVAAYMIFNSKSNEPPKK